MPTIIEIAIQGKTKPFQKVGNYQFRFVTRNFPFTEDQVQYLQLLDALKDIKRIPDAPVTETIQTIKEIMQQMTTDGVQIMVDFVHWQSLLRLSPYVVVGILLGVWVGKDLNELVFKKMMASIVLIMVAGMFYLEHKPLENVSSSRSIASFVGITTGFTSMVGNQAGGFATAYFMSMRLPKVHFIGTYAWLFLFINVFKLPFHIFSWHTVNASSIGINCFLFPFQIVGFYAGVYTVKQINEARYRKIILWLTAFSALVVFF